MFAVSDMVEYMHSVSENSYTASYNYFFKVSSSVNSHYSYSPTSILTNEGKEIYQDGKNPMFRIFCGDTFVTGYDVGAALIMTMSIDFKNKLEKNTFDQ